MYLYFMFCKLPWGEGGRGTAHGTAYGFAAGDNSSTKSAKYDK